MHKSLDDFEFWPTFRSQAAIVSKKTLFAFPYRKAQVTKIDLAVK